MTAAEKKAAAARAEHEREAARRRIAAAETSAAFFQSVIDAQALPGAVLDRASRALDTANEEARFLRNSIGGAAA